MTKGVKGQHADLQITGRQPKQTRGHYHGLTELGIGQHEKIKKRLEEERHRDYQDHMARKEMERSSKSQWGCGDSPKMSESTGSVCDIGYETSQSITQQRKQLNETRKAEYVAHLAAQSSSMQTERHDGSSVYTQTQAAASRPNDECSNSLHVSPGGGVETPDERKQKQRDYAEALREQIAEKKRNSEQSRKKEKEDDKKNMEMAQGSTNTFNYGSYNQNNTSPQ